MSTQDFRIEKDSMGEVRVPSNALYSAQTQRAVENFPISGITFPRALIRALAIVKAAAALANADLELLPREKADAIAAAALKVAEGDYDEQFPIDIFQTGSETSSQTQRQRSDCENRFDRRLKNSSQRRCEYVSVV